MHDLCPPPKNDHPTPSSQSGNGCQLFQQEEKCCVNQRPSGSGVGDDVPFSACGSF